MYIARLVLGLPALFLTLFIPVASIAGYPILDVLHVSIYVYPGAAFIVSFLICGHEEVPLEEPEPLELTEQMEQPAQ